MHARWLALLLMATPFWETKAPRQWSDEELETLMTDSPWAQSEIVHVFLATAQPMREGEAERRRRYRDPARAPDPLEEEYLEFLRENGASHIVLAVRLPRARALDDAAESKRMEEESYLRVGKTRHKMTGHFPPTSSDPYLRLAFPRVVRPTDKNFRFELYLPSVPGAWHEVEFPVKSLSYRGKLEM